ncbi:MAG: RNA methyltransferase [Clostridia bacterium]|nr:RNA methyltransferase [Clostridia bacterium]
MEITSRTNPHITDAVKLKSKKERDEKGVFAFEGIKLCREALRRGAALSEVFLTEKAADVLAEELTAKGCAYHTVSDPVYEKLTADRSPDGVFCIAPFLTELHGKVPGELGKSIILCDIQDAGNLGTCIRSALAFGIDTLILAGECADIYNPKCVRSTMGALFSQRIVRVCDPLAAIELCRGRGKKVFAAALRRDAVSLDDLTPDRDTVFAVGNEGHGLSDLFIEACDGRVVIPMEGGTESLNAAVASSVLMWRMRSAK